jgi:flavin reductase (DIM6/NTAB) family NADH-FMN oxidoreductase RutF
MSDFSKKAEKSKIDLGPKVASYAMPVALIGANINAKANFLVAAWFMAAGISPPKIAVALNKTHYTNHGIKENKTFSVCIPSEDMIEATDYCGLTSGSKADKSSVFDVFYGKLKTAPMITQCPLNMECKLEKIVDNGGHEIFIGEIYSTITEEKYLTEGQVDLKKVKPFMLSLNDRVYHELGKSKAKAWQAGNNYKPQA